MAATSSFLFQSRHRRGGKLRSRTSSSISEGKPISLYTYTEAAFSQMFLAGGSPGCSNGIEGLDGGVGFATASAIAADAQDNLYIADWSPTQLGCTRIRRVDFEGNVVNVAGTGMSGYMDGPGTVDEFYEPSGIAGRLDAEPLHLGLIEQPHPDGVPLRHDHHHRRQQHARIQRRQRRAQHRRLGHFPIFPPESPSTRPATSTSPTPATTPSG